MLQTSRTRRRTQSRRCCWIDTEMIANHNDPTNMNVKVLIRLNKKITRIKAFMISHFRDLGKKGSFATCIAWIQRDIQAWGDFLQGVFLLKDTWTSERKCIKGNGVWYQWKKERLFFQQQEACFFFVSVVVDEKRLYLIPKQKCSNLGSRGNMRGMWIFSIIVCCAACAWSHLVLEIIGWPTTTCACIRLGMIVNTCRLLAVSFSIQTT